MASLVVPCKCGTKLAAPESAVGKQIRCPKCGALTTVPAMLPAEEVPVVDAKVTAPPPKSKPKPKSAPDTNSTICIGCNSMVFVVGEITDGRIHCPKCGFANPVRNRVGESEDDDEDDRPRKKPKVRAAAVDEDEEEDDRPRKKKRPRYADDDDDYDHDRKRKKPKRKAGGGGALVAGLIVGGLLLVCVGIGVAVAMFSGKGGLLAKKAPVPPGWEEHNHPEDGFKAFAPPGAQYGALGGVGFQPAEFGGGRFGAGPDGIGNLPAVERVAHLTSAWNANAARVDLQVVRYRDRLPSSVHSAMRRMTNAQFGGMEMRSVKWLGYDAVEYTHTNGVMRMVYTNRHFVIATVSGPNMGRAKPEEEAAFFDNVEVTN